MPTGRKIKVIVVDDSTIIRRLLTDIIHSAADIEVVATASDAFEARELIRTHNPDVVTLDVEMPGMNGLEFLSRLMRLRPTPVIMISSLTAMGANTTMQALALGAVDVIAKPQLAGANELLNYAEDICDKIRAAAGAHISFETAPPVPWTPPATAASTSPCKLIAIGASTGGTEAIRTLLDALEPRCPPVVIVQHMPPGFTLSFAERLSTSSRLTVCEATHGQALLPGHAYVAPGGYHMRVGRNAGRLVAEIGSDDPINKHRPAVDALFHSIPPALAKDCFAVILTGMGKDGAQGLLTLRQAGAYTIAQDETSCVVFGMPREAIALGAACEVLSLSAIAGQLNRKLGF